MAAAKLQRTRTPGIYSRGDSGLRRRLPRRRQAAEGGAETYDAARRLKDRRRTQVSDGDYRPAVKAHVRAVRARSGSRATRGTERASASARAASTAATSSATCCRSSALKSLTGLRRADIAAFVAWLVDDEAQAERHRRENVEREKARAQRRRDRERPSRKLAAIRDPGPLSDRTVERIVAVLKACLGSAR